MSATLYFIVWLFGGLLIVDEAFSLRTDEGFPNGYMSVCPGSTKPAEIPRSQLQYLFFIVYGKSSMRRKYTYWNARNMAKDADIVDFQKKTIVIAVGYLDSAYFPIASLFATTYKNLDYNVIVVDNQRFSTVHYHLAARLMRPVGKHVAEILFELTKEGLDPLKTELLGFSLGGQTIGFIAKNYRNFTGRNLSRITSLEPSGPCFRTLGAEYRLSSSDADFVQVIHTNIDGFGMATPMGHVDFYVNGGEYQPSEITLYPCTMTCSHFRVLFLWLQALKNPGKFIGLKCDSIQEARDHLCYDKKPKVTNIMGIDVDTKKTGLFYVPTTSYDPYYMGEYGMNKNMAGWSSIANQINVGNETVIYT